MTGQPLSQERTAALPADSQGLFLETVFTSFEEAGLDYLVERNYEGLPYDLDGHDIDIIMRGNSIDQALQIIRERARQCGARTTAPRTIGDGLKWVISVGRGPAGDHWGVRFDLKPCACWRGVQIEEFDDALAASTRHHRIRVQDRDRAAFFAMMDKLLNGLDPAVNGYDQKILRAWGRSREKLELLARTTFGRPADLLLDALGRGEFSSLKQQIWKLKLALIRRQLAQAPGRLLRSQLSNYWNYLGRLLRRDGVWVAVLGLDGSGKTTLCQQVREEIEGLLHTGSDYVYHRPNLLPSLARLFGREKDWVKTAANPHAEPPDGLAKSLLRLTYYTLDYFLGYWLLVHPKMLRRPRLVIFDRYFHVYFVDAARSKIAAPEWIIRFFSLFVPRPDLFVLLTGDPEDYYRRKPELPLAVLRRQQEKLERLASRLKAVAWVDTSRELSQSRQAMVDAILETFGRRLKWQ